MRTSACMRCTLALGLLLLVAACGDAPPAEVPEHAHGAAESHDEHEGEAEAGFVEIDPGLRRDLRLTTATVERRHDAPGSLALGELQPDSATSAEVSSPVEARVLRVLASAGDPVVAGQPLVELHSVALGQAWASYLGAEARMHLAHAAEERASALADEGVAPRREVEAAQADRAAADAERRAARVALEALGIADPATIERADAGSGNFTLTAPLDGTLLERDAVPGRLVPAGQRLFRQADLRTLGLVVHVYERDALRVRLGATADVTLSALPGVALPGRVTWIGAEVEPGTRTVPVRIEIANEDGRLRPGLSGLATLPLEGEGDLLAVPAAALQRGPDGWCIFLPAGEDRFECRPVGRGRDLGGLVELVSGAEEGETVVVEGAFLLRAELERRRGGGDAHEH